MRAHYDSRVKITRRSAVSVALAAVVFIVWPAQALAATDPGLKTAGKFAVLAGTTVTASGLPSWISGSLGVWPGTAITGFPPSLASGSTHAGDSVAHQAQLDMTGAYTRAKNAPCPATNNKSGVNLGGLTLVPGVYCQTTAPTLTGTLTLSGGGVYIFQIGSTLVTAPGARISLTGGATPCEIFWAVSSSTTLDVGTAFVGNIMSQTLIAMNDGATLEGRALGKAAVTLIHNRIIQPGGCGATAPPLGTPPTGNTLPTTLGFSLSIPATGVPLELRGEFPWLPLIGIGAGIALGGLGFSSWRRRRRAA
jgi:type VI secretion system secreted protein VgrG